jgi:hypothetical protein
MKAKLTIGTLVIEGIEYSLYIFRKKLSPVFPHGKIPIPGAPKNTGMSSMTVEGVWNAAKVFDKEGVDLFKCAHNDSQGNSKRMTVTDMSY